MVALAPTALGDPLRPPPAIPTEPPADRPTFDAPPKIRPIAGLRSALYAKEPLVADPVAFCIADDGAILIAESLRQERGVEDNRSSPWWLLDDLAATTVEDRLRMYERWAHKREGGMAFYTAYDDRVRRIEDSDGDGRADRGTIFAGPFNDPLDGTGAGVIAREGDVWYTNIPHLWRLRDVGGDFVADERTPVYSGFGVRVALRGHDMHGLAWGPDGKLYWSIGDRGYHVTLPDGRVLADPRSGAVFRCNADGSDLEIFATGLRNPQELAFDDYGNLFTGDNNSDAGDKARIVYVVEGGETGWRMDYQTLEGTNVRGPWNQEETWAIRPDLAPDQTSTWPKVQPAFVVPPLAHVGSGPAGLVHYPGLGLPERFRGTFFLCDFLGGDAYSRVLSFRVEPVGAGFRVVDVAPFIENVLPTDIDFGYDGRIYVSDWGGGWYSKNYGEIYAVWDEAAVADPRVAETARLFREGFRDRPTDELRSLLRHADQRVRLRAQTTLGERGPSVRASLVDEARNGPDRLGRIHAIWGLGMLARDGWWPDAVADLVPLLEDADAEIRAQTAKVLGEARLTSSADRLMRLLSDDAPRVRYFAAMALGRMRIAEAHAPIVAMLAENDGRDVFLRHAGVVALEWLRDEQKTLLLASEPLVELRLCAALVLRRWKHPAIARLLQDADDRVVLEAARAINDVPIPEAMPKLAELARRFADVSAAAERPVGLEVRRELWRNIENASAIDLLREERFATKPDLVETGDRFEGIASLPKDEARNYLQRVSAVVEPPATGAYVFQIASDDQSVLRIAPGERPEGLQPIAKVEGYSGRGDWTGQPGQSSAPVLLEAGRRYYLEALHAEGGGDDFLAVGWVRPDDTTERPIGGGVDRPLETPLVRRIINANRRENSVASAAVLADLARSPALVPAMQLEAMQALAEWPAPGPRDRVHGAFDPIDPKDRDVAAWTNVLKQKLPGLVQFGGPDVRNAARELAVKAGVPLDGTASFETVADGSQPVAERIACLRQLCADRDQRADEAIEIALASPEPLLRAEGRLQRALRSPAAAAPLLEAGLASGDPGERQRAVVALGAAPADPALDAVLAAVMTKLEEGTLEPALRLDAIRAAEGRTGSELASRAERWLSSLASKDPLARYSVALAGGDPRRGHDVVHFHASATCLKCHAVGGVGGDAAPTLDGVASRLTREALLASLVDPGAVVAPGFGEHSAMPAMGPILTLEELRDAVEYLSTLR
jgi:putative membrane-bound dehydrogenase-like protein